MVALAREPAISQRFRLRILLEPSLQLIRCLRRSQKLAELQHEVLWPHGIPCGLREEEGLTGGQVALRLRQEEVQHQACHVAVAVVEGMEEEHV